MFTDFGGKQKVAQELIQLIQANKSQARKPILILLYGNIGTGKTTFAQMLIKQITLTNENIISPTFPIVQHYTSHNPDIWLDVWHYDLYRIKNTNEVWQIGLDESIANGISIIEWPENLPDISEIEEKMKTKLHVIKLRLTIENDNTYCIKYV